MCSKTDYSQERMTVTQWLKKKPQDHFTRRVPAPEALCEPVRTLLLQSLLPGERLQWMVELPPQGILRHKGRTGWLGKVWPMWKLTPGWLVTLTNHRLLLLPTILDTSPQIIAVPVEDILYLEQGIILLFSWVEVHWIERGIAHEETLYYDSGNEDDVLTLIQMLRRSIARIPPFSSEWADEKLTDDQRDQEILPGWQQQLPLKFLNLIPRYGLLNEEQICQTVYRPAQWHSLLGLARVMTSARLVVLTTNAYLLLAAEDRSNTDISYGLILTFLPVQFVQSIEVSRNGKRCSLNIHLQAGQAARDWSIPFPLEMERAVRNFARTC